MEIYFEFEAPVVQLEKKLEELRQLSKEGNVEIREEIRSLEKKLSQLIEDIFSKLTPWERVQLSRHPNRPYSSDYIEALFSDFMELHGDRCFGDDKAIVGGIATWKPTGLPIMIIGHQKGRTTKQKLERNFGMARPEGYRKAMRLMDLAERMRMPLLTLIDTPGAYPGIETEERGQAQAIAESIQLMSKLTVPVAAIVIGEGGSGGALALGVANRILMQQYSTYSVISPEGCASILWSDSKMAERASECLKMNPKDLLEAGVIDGIIPEPKGSAHRDWPEAFKLMRETLSKELEPLFKKRWVAPSVKTAPIAKGSQKKVISISEDPGRFRQHRVQKFRNMGMAALGHTREQGPT